MSESYPDNFDSSLLDLHLGHLSEAEKGALQERIATSPRLAAQHEALTGVFRVLQAGTQTRMPRDLVARTLARVRAAGPIPRVIRPHDALTDAVEHKSERVIRLGNLRDIVAIAAVVVLAVGLGVPGMLHMRDRQQRLGCSWNLAQLGTGLQQYSSTYNASLPFVGWSGPRNSWQPTSDPGIVTVPNRQHVYPLLRLSYVTDPRVFVCPSQQHVPMPQSEVQRHNDFLEARNVSYAYQNMAGVRPSANDNPELPVLADDNPLFADGLPLFDGRRFGFGDPTSANSHAHKSAGQNILTLGGYVKWATSPNCGINGDNIWILQGVTDYTGHEGPIASTDSHLLK